MSNTLYILSAVIASIGYLLFFLFPLNKGAPFIPNNPKKICSLIEILKKRYKLKSFKKAVDLGSGDGRVVVSIAKQGISCDGIEQNKVLCNLSKKRIKNEKVENICNIFNSDFLKAPLSDYDLVILWQSPQIMGKLSEKLKKELKPGTIVCSYYFYLPKSKKEFSHKGWHIYKI